MAWWSTAKHHLEMFEIDDVFGSAHPSDHEHSPCIVEEQGCRGFLGATRGSSYSLGEERFHLLCASIAGTDYESNMTDELLVTDLGVQVARYWRSRSREGPKPG